MIIDRKGYLRDMDNNNLNSYNGGNGYNNGPGGGPGGPGGPGGQPPRRQNLLMLLVAALVTLVGMSFFMKMLSGVSNQEISYNEFIRMVDAGEVESVEIMDDQININPKTEKQENPFMQAPEINFYTGRVQDDGLIAHLQEKDVEIWGQIPDNSGFLLSMLLTYVLPFVAIIFLFNFLMRRMSGGGGPMGVGKSNAKVYVQKETGVTFKDVAGEDEAKESLQEVVEPRNPCRRWWISCTIRADIPRSEPSFPRVRFWWAPPERVRRCWPRLWQERRMCPSFP